MLERLWDLERDDESIFGLLLSLFVFNFWFFFTVTMSWNFLVVLKKLFNKLFGRINRNRKLKFFLRKWVNEFCQVGNVKFSSTWPVVNTWRIPKSRTVNLNFTTECTFVCSVKSSLFYFSSFFLFNFSTAIKWVYNFLRPHFMFPAFFLVESEMKIHFFCLF